MKKQKAFFLQNAKGKYLVTHCGVNTSGDFDCNVCLWLWVIKGRWLAVAGQIPHLLWHLDNMNQLSE